MTDRKKKPELLIPAGSLDVLKVAVTYGADAVYVGGQAFGLRANAKNFSMDDLRAGIAFAHAHGVKVYVTANIFAHNDDLLAVRDYFGELKDIRPDALLISDPGIYRIWKEVCPEIDLHVSTQANNTNYGTFLFWRDLGAKRVVTGRELSLAEIKEIRDRIPADLEIESFVHGAMCISYSGRCLLSNFLTGRDANQGACTHPCRWEYAVMEATRPGQYMPVLENDRGSFIFNSKDLCMIDHLPQMIEAGIDSLKVEGRMKTALYVATLARTYRRAIDDYFTDPETYRAGIPWYLEEVSDGTFREYTTGFFFGKPDASAQIYGESTYVKTYTFLGMVQGRDAAGRAVWIQKNKFSVGDKIELMKPDGQTLFAVVSSIQDEEGNEMASAPHAKQELHVALVSAKDGSPVPVEEYNILRRAEGQYSVS